MPRLHLVLLVLAAAAVLASPSLATSPPPVFGAPVVVTGAPTFTGEPSIAVDGAGLYYIAAPGASHTFVWRSLDAGAHWSAQPNSTGSSGDSDVAIDAAGTVYVADLNPDVPLSISSNNASSWIAAGRAAPASSGPDRQWLAAGDAGDLYVTWRTGGDYLFSRSTDGGVTFPVKGQVVASDVSWGGPLLRGHDGALYAALWTGSSGSVTIGGGGVSTGVSQLRLAKSVDHGAHWTLPAATGPRGSAVSVIFPVVAEDRAGNLYIAWAEGASSVGLPGTSTSTTLFVVASADGGATWTAPRVLSHAGTHAVFPWIVAGGAGRVDVFWFEGVPAAGTPMGDPNVAEGMSWFVEMAQSLDANSPSPTYDATRVTPNAVHVGSLCAAGTLCAAGVPMAANDRRLLDFFEAAIDGTGAAVVTWTQDGPLGVASPIKVDGGSISIALGGGTQDVDVAFARQVDGPTL